jgi:hypothetical protein
MDLNFDFDGHVVAVAAKESSMDSVAKACTSLVVERVFLDSLFFYGNMRKRSAGADCCGGCLHLFRTSDWCFGDQSADVWLGQPNDGGLEVRDCTGRRLPKIPLCMRGTSV